MSQLFKAAGISKQAFHQYRKRKRTLEERLLLLLVIVEKTRKDHPGMGLRKMYDMIQPDFIGRDRFIAFFSALGYKVKFRINYRRTTYRGKHTYPNRIKGMEIRKPNKVWQSDITYFQVGDRFYYLTFIIDVYTREIVGYHVSKHLRASANVKALKMAIKRYGAPEIHHSDRGTQYTSHEYIALLQSHNISISMSIEAWENAYAERINRTIKEEYLFYRKIKSFSQLQKEVRKSVRLYNTGRIHNHLNKTTPAAFRQKVLTLHMDKRPVVAIYSDEEEKGIRYEPSKKNTTSSITKPTK